VGESLIRKWVHAVDENGKKHIANGKMKGNRRGRYKEANEWEKA
jgi:hypothetical protein